MLRSINEMTGYQLRCKESSIGKIKDFIFDQEQWTVRWLVADTGTWLSEKKVLISPITLKEPDWSTQEISVQMTKEEIEEAPGLDFDAPVSRQYEIDWFKHHNWPYYWGGIGLWGSGLYPAGLFAAKQQEENIPKQEEDTPDFKKDILRSAAEVSKYRIHAEDGEMGHADDFIVDSKSWTVRYLVVDTRNWLPGRKVLVAPDWIDSIAWGEQMVKVGLTRKAIQESPEYVPTMPVNRDYENRLYDYYGRPVYW